MVSKNPFYWNSCKRQPTHCFLVGGVGLGWGGGFKGTYFDKPRNNVSIQQKLL